MIDHYNALFHKYSSLVRTIAHFWLQFSRKWVCHHMTKKWFPGNDCGIMYFSAHICFPAHISFCGIICSLSFSCCFLFVCSCSFANTDFLTNDCLTKFFLWCACPFFVYFCRVCDLVDTFARNTWEFLDFVIVEWIILHGEFRGTLVFERTENSNENNYHRFQSQNLDMPP